MLDTYVTRINGQSGPTSPFMPDNGIILDSRSFRRQGTSGTPAVTIYTSVNEIAGNVRPMFVNNISGDDYEINLPNGVEI